jgi:hypothetical protein
MVLVREIVKMSKNSSNKFIEWECPECNYFVSGAAKSVNKDKQVHMRLGCMSEMQQPQPATAADYAAVESAVVATVVPVVAPVVAESTEMPLDELRGLFAGLTDGIGESVEKSRKLAEREHKTYLSIIEIEGMIQVMRDEVLPQLMSVPAGYRDEAMIETINQKIATGISQLALKKSKKQFARAAKAAKEIAAAEKQRMLDLSAECARMNREAEEAKIRPHEDRFEEMQLRLKGYIDGTVHVPTKDGSMPFMRDLCWKVRHYHKEIQDQDWSESVAAAIDECLKRVSLYDITTTETVPVYRIDGQNIVTSENRAVDVELRLDRAKLATLQKKIVDLRRKLQDGGLEFGAAEDQAIRDLKLWGSGKSVEELYFNPGGNYKARVRKEHDTTMGHAIREKLLARDNPESNQS